jgi:hypothetical protein
MKNFLVAAVAAAAALSLGACTRDTAGHLQFDPVKACRASVLAAPSIDAAKRVALDAGAKSGVVEHGVAVATDLSVFASLVCASTNAPPATTAPAPVPATDPAPVPATDPAPPLATEPAPASAAPTSG